MSRVWLCTLLIGLSACAKTATLTLAIDEPPAGTLGTAGNPKALFSIWQESNNYYSMDLSGFSYDVSKSITMTTVAGSCTCTVLIHGANDLGNVTFSGCSGNLAINGGCGSFNGADTYTNNGINLQVCSSPNTCELYR
jgi:hypothetical protein